MADEEDVPAVLDQPLGLAVDLGDERAGRVEIVEAARLPPWPAPPWARRARRRPPARRRAPRRAPATKIAPLALSAVDDELVVDDLVADIDRRAIALERQLDDADRAVDAGAKAARRRDQQGEGGLVGHLRFTCARALRDCLPARKPVPCIRSRPASFEDVALRLFPSKAAAAALLAFGARPAAAPARRHRCESGILTALHRLPAGRGAAPAGDVTLFDPADQPRCQRDRRRRAR